MAPKGNNMIPNGHFHKNWQRFAKTRFNQPSRKLRRKQNRVLKARAIAPRPAKGLLQPIVRCPTIRYQEKLRAGRGYTLEELKAAGLNAAFARTIGISIDYRRRNKSLESIQTNAQRLKEYCSKLILFPLNNKVRNGEATEDQQKVAVQLMGKIMPVKQAAPKLKAHVPEEERQISAVSMLRKARADARLVGIRIKRQKEAAVGLEK